jgi:hypothetical protein
MKTRESNTEHDPAEHAQSAAAVKKPWQAPEVITSNLSGLSVTLGPGSDYRDDGFSHS